MLTRHRRPASRRVDAHHVGLDHHPVGFQLRKAGSSHNHDLRHFIGNCNLHELNVGCFKALLYGRPARQDGFDSPLGVSSKTLVPVG
jgi:hypothetical protein